MIEPVEVLADNRRTDGRREWSSVGAWLQPGQSIAILSADDPALAQTALAEKQMPVPRVPPRLFPERDDD